MDDRSRIEWRGNSRGILVGDQAAQSQEGRLVEWLINLRRSSHGNLRLIPG
jgi:hypothetical protein